MKAKLKDSLINFAVLGSPLLLIAVFVILKLAAVIDWNWLIILSPLLWYAALGGLIWWALYRRFKPKRRTK